MIGLAAGTRVWTPILFPMAAFFLIRKVQSSMPITSLRTALIYSILAESPQGPALQRCRWKKSCAELSQSYRLLQGQCIFLFPLTPAKLKSPAALSMQAHP